MMRKDTLSIGRGGAAAWVDVQIVGSSKISREHLRLRADGDGRFFIQDVSLWGTSVDGVPIPPAVKSAEGVAQPGPEQPAPGESADRPLRRHRDRVRRQHRPMNWLYWLDAAFLAVLVIGRRVARLPRLGLRS